MRKLYKWLDKHFLLLFQLYWVFAFIFFISMFIFSCRATRISPEQKAYEAQQAEIKQLQALRKAFPCDTSIATVSIDTMFITLASDTIKGPGDTIYINNYTRTSAVTNTTRLLLDNALIQQMRDSIKGMDYQMSLIIKQYNEQRTEINKNKIASDEKEDKLKKEIVSLRPWKRAVVMSAIGLSIFTAIGLFMKIKNII